MLTRRRRAFGTEILPAVLMVISAALTTSCTDNPEENAQQPQSASEHKSTVAAHADDGGGQAFDRQRAEMVAQQLAARDITDRQVLEAMGRVPRHEFVPAPMRPLAYADSPLPIGHGQTISQPYIVALMTQLTAPRPAHKALDIGTGSGYQAAVLAELVQDVYSIEIIEPLANEARQRLQSLGYKNIHVRCGDGYRGWPDEAPFDIIIVAAAPDHVPEPLIEQLAPGGKLVIPVGDQWQDLLVVEKADDGTVTRRQVAPVAFVPMTGEAQD
jgi:protein-L-isoaspartate(D-aspartate) O-methyltransferase